MTVSKLLDSSLWLTYFFNGSYAEIIENNELFFLSTLSLFEIEKKMQKKKIDKGKIKKAMDFVKSKSLVVSVDGSVAEKAVVVAWCHGLATVDALIYASSLLNNAELLTLDNDFRRLEGVCVLKYC